MKRITKLLLGTLIGGTAWQIYKWGRPASLRGRAGEATGIGDQLGDLGADPGDTVIVEIVEFVTDAGIADVDPEPLSHVAGEGIDPDRDVAAQSEIKEQRARMPGKTP